MIYPTDLLFFKEIQFKCTAFSTQLSYLSAYTWYVVIDYIILCYYILYCMLFVIYYTIFLYIIHYSIHQPA